MWTKEFGTFDEFLDYAQNAPSSMASRSSRRIEDARSEWMGSATFPEAMRDARQGWKGAAAVKSAVADIELRSMQAICRPEVVYDVIGESIDVGVFCEGRPDCWQDTIVGDEPRQDDGEAITLQVNLGASRMVEAASIIARGSALVALATGLEQAGKRVRIVGVSEVAAKGTTETIRIIVPLKNDGEAIDIDRVAFALASPSMLRRMIWAVRETAPAAVRVPLGVTKMGASYGTSVVHIPALQNNSLVFDRIEPQQPWTADYAKRWVLGALQGLGVQIGDGSDTTRLRPDYDAPIYQEQRAAFEERMRNQPVAPLPQYEAPKPDITPEY